MNRSAPRIRTIVLGALLVGAGGVGSGCIGEGSDATGSGGRSGSGGGPSGAGGSTAGTGGAPSGSGGTTPTGTGGRVASTGGSPGSGGRAGGGVGGSSAGGVAGGGGAGSGGRAGASGLGGQAGVVGSGGRSGGAGSTGSGGRGGSTGAGGAGSMPSAGCGISDWLKSGRGTVSVGGTNRDYILKIPDNYDTNRAYKLIFGFHARGGNATQVAGSGNNDYYGLYNRAGGSAIFVSPEGLDAGWRNDQGRDINFVKAMLAHFTAKLCIDERRIFSTGFSFGGMMSDAIGCAMADVFRAIAPMAGGLPNAEHPYSGCEQPNMHPIAVWMAHGDNDTVVPLSDGKAALDLFVKRSGCQQQTMPVTPSPCVAYQGCMADYPIHFCQFSGGHQVPSFASAGIWAFFNQF